MGEKSIRLSDILSFLDNPRCLLRNDRESLITGVNSICNSNLGDITFCTYIGKKGVDLIRSSKASAIICQEFLKDELVGISSDLIFVNNPRLSFLRIMKLFHQEKQTNGIHKTSIVESKNIGHDVYVGPFSYISKDVIIGDNTMIMGNVHIYDKTSIGKNVRIESGTVIGSDGFGFEKNENNVYEFFPHIGGVEIHDDVDIGTNVCIDKGVFENTVISEGTKIDNLVHVAHNVKIGKNCLIVAHVVLGGSCILEDNVHVAMSAVIRDGGIVIGKNSLIGMGSVVTKNIPENSTVIGIPAKPI